MPPVAPPWLERRRAWAPAGLPRRRPEWHRVGALGAALVVWLGARSVPPRISMPLASMRTPTASLGATPAMARVERELGLTGDERLRGETRFDLLRSGVFALVSEEAQLDRQGRLVWAQVHVSWRNAGAAESRDALSSELTSFDAIQGLCISTRDGGRSRTRQIPADLPWSYLPLATAEGEPLSTPVAAIIARRAAELGPALRLIDPSGHDVSLASDQILVADGPEAWVVLGDDLAVFARGPTGATELVRLHLAALDLDIGPRQAPPER